MKRNLILAGITACGMAASALGAGPETKMSWGFDTGDNPANGLADAGNPIPATATALIDYGFGTGYYIGRFDVGFGDYGTPTGIWDIGQSATGQGSVKMDVGLFGATPETKLDYTVVVNMFASEGLSPGFPYSGTVSFSIPGAQVSSVDKQITSSGRWIESTYSWQQLAVGSGPITLTMNTVEQRGLLLDSLAFSVIGDLTPVPEPSVSQLGALAALMLGIGTLRRSKTVA